MNWEELKKKANGLRYEDQESIKDWLEGLNPTSRQTYLGRFIRFCVWLDKTPDQIYKERLEDLRSKDKKIRRRYEKLTLQFHDWVLKETDTPHTAANFLSAVRSFFSRNEVPLTFKRGEVAIPSGKIKQYIPTLVEVRKMVEAAGSIRDRFIVLALFQSGLDCSTLASLNYGDVAWGLERGLEPCPVEKVRKKEKARAVEFRTFFGKESIDALKLYLDERRRRGEILQADSPLILNRTFSGRITEDRISETVRNLGRVLNVPTGWKFRGAHAFRKHFKSKALSAKIPEKFVDLMCGHVLPRGGAYIKPDWEDLAEEYKKVYEKALRLYGVENSRVGVVGMSEYVTQLLTWLKPLLTAPGVRDQILKAIQEAEAEVEWDPLHDPKPIQLILKEIMEG